MATVLKSHRREHHLQTIEADCPAKRIAEFAPRGANGGKGEFIVRLMVDTSRFTIEMTLDFDQGTTEFRTSVGEMGGSKRRFQRPPSLLRVLTPEFVPFFVFDGELAHALLDPKKTRAREALEVQFQLSSLNQFSRLMERYWEEKTRNSTAKGDKGLTQRRNKYALTFSCLATWLKTRLFRLRFLVRCCNFQAATM